MGGLCIAGAVVGGSGEGGATARVKNKLESTIINNNAIDIMNEQVNTVATNVFMKHANKCKAKQTQTVDITGMSAGNLEFGNINMNMEGLLNFDCINKSKVRADIVGNISGRVTNMLLGSYDNKALSKMVATANAKGKSEFMSSPPKVNAEIDLENKNTIKTDIDKKIRNIVNHTVNNNFTNEIINSCIPTTNQIQSFIGRYATIGNLKVGNINHDMKVQMIGKCKNLNNSAAKIISKVVSNLGLINKDIVKSEVSATMESSSEAVSIGKGIGVSSSGSCVLCVMVIAGVFVFKEANKSQKGGGYRVDTYNNIHINLYYYKYLFYI